MLNELLPTPHPRHCRLASTIGPKASYSKLDKRVVLSANVSKLCDLVAEPPEPLALRLSSNLLVGVVRFESTECPFFANADEISEFIRLNTSTTLMMCSPAGRN